jgi:uncharacterized cupredoxin-like copper-binding protein
VKRWIGGLMIGILAWGIAACGGPAGPAAPGPSGEIRITMSEYKFQPSAIQVKAGQEVRLVLVNAGKKTHELLIGRGVKTEEGKPAGYQENLFASIQVQVSGENFEYEEDEHAVVVKPGGKATIVFTVPEGWSGELVWEMGCFEDNGVHYEEGMKGQLTIIKR